MGTADGSTGPAVDGGLGARLQAARVRAFVGRRAELELFRNALDTEPAPFAVLHLHGPGGIGKSALVERFARIASTSGRRPVLVDGHVVEPSPAGFKAALGSELGVPPEDAIDALIDRSRPVLLIDTYELLGVLDDWVRTWLLPRLPDGSLVVLAGREPPRAGWRTDPGWDDLLRDVALRDLHADDARSLLEARGVPAVRHDDVLEVTRGHPLALVLFADVVDQQRNVGDLTLQDAPEVIDRLLQRFVRDLPSEAHRRALYTTAHVGAATEALLRDTVDGVPARELFDWLRTLSFTRPASTGVALHDLVGQVLDSELRWRDPDGYVALHDEVTDHLQQRLLDTTGEDQRRAMLDVLRLYRLNPITRPFFDWERSGELWAEPAEADDHDSILALTRLHEGDASADVARYWLDRQPEAFTVFRDAASAEPAGFVAHLTLADTPSQEVEIDPVAGVAWDHVRAHGPLRAGDQVRIMRYWIARDTYQQVDTFHLVSAQAILDWLASDQLAWAFGAVTDADFYAPMFAFVDFHRLDQPAVAVGDHTVGMFARDMRRSSRRGWWDLLGERIVSVADDPGLLPEPQGRLLVLAQEDFHDAVREALKGLARSGGLDGNPLLRSRVVVERDDDRPPDEVLADLLQQAADELADHPRDQKLRRALDRTYFRPAPTQEAAAQVLDLPFSTFRRHLRKGVEHVADWMWERELHGQPDHR